MHNLPWRGTRNGEKHKLPKVLFLSISFIGFIVSIFIVGSKGGSTLDKYDRRCWALGKLLLFVAKTILDVFPSKIRSVLMFSIVATRVIG